MCVLNVSKEILDVTNHEYVFHDQWGEELVSHSTQKEEHSGYDELSGLLCDKDQAVFVNCHIHEVLLLLPSIPI